MTDKTEAEGRKIELDTSVYCPRDYHVANEDKTCDHDYPPEPKRYLDSGAVWGCTRCPCEITFYVWD